MGTSFLFDGSKKAKNMMKLLLLYSDDGFEIVPPKFISDYVNLPSGQSLNNLKDLQVYEQGLDAAIEFVEKNTLQTLTITDFHIFTDCINGYIDYFKSTPDHADKRLETGEDGLTYVNLIAPEFLDIHKNDIDEIKLNTFKYRLAINNTYAIHYACNPQINFAVTDNSKRILDSFQNYSSVYNLVDGINKMTCILLPNFDQLSITDVMELKLKSYDEFCQLNYYLYTLQIEYDGDMQKINNYIQCKIEPAIKELEHKIRGLKYGFSQKILKELKNPLSYVPFLVSFISNIPNPIALGTSLALVATDVVLDVAKQRHEISGSPLYSICKIRKGIQKKI